MKNLKLFINNEEYDFGGTVTFSFHPTNFSKMVFNDVIKKADNVYPKMLQNLNISREFSIATVWSNNDLIFLVLLIQLAVFRYYLTNQKHVQ